MYGGFDPQAFMGGQAPYFDPAMVNPFGGGFAPMGDPMAMGMGLGMNMPGMGMYGGGFGGNYGGVPMMQNDQFTQQQMQ